MNVDEIRLLYDYHYWANRRLLDACAKVTPEQYAASTSLGTGLPGLRATLIHLVSAEHAWRTTFQQSFVPADAIHAGWREEDLKPWGADDLTETDLPTLEALMERCQVEEQAMRAYLAGLRDEDMNGIVRYPIGDGIVRERLLWHCLLHLVNHGTQHRSEAASLLTSFGQSPGDFDFTFFLNHHLNLPI